MVLLLINVALAVIPSLFLLGYFYFKDTNKREPSRLIWRTFFIGSLAVIPAGLIELAIDWIGDPFSGVALLAVKAFILVALVEESMKYAVVRMTVYNRPEFDERADGIVYTIAASLGFAVFENALYSLGPPSVLIIRGITAVPLHAIAAGLMGYWIGRAKFGEKGAIWRGLFAAVFIHGLYDFLLFTGTLYSLLIFPILIIGWLRLRKLYKEAIAIDATSPLKTPLNEPKSPRYP